MDSQAASDAEGRAPSTQAWRVAASRRRTAIRSGRHRVALVVTGLTHPKVCLVIGRFSAAPGATSIASDAEEGLKSAYGRQPSVEIMSRGVGMAAGVFAKFRRVVWFASLMGPAGLSNAARAQADYADPAGSGAIVGALHWIQGTLLGTVATVVAVIAVAAVGFMMLTGRLNWRYGATVILGCFILFGAASIVGGIQAVANTGY